MPSYTLKDTSTLEEFEVVCSWDELQVRLNEMPDLIQVLSTPKIVSSTGNLHSKTPDGFKDLLGRIKKGSGENSTIKT